MLQRIIVFAFGIAMGVTTVLGIQSCRPRQNEVLVLLSDLDLEREYFFGPNHPPPLRGVIKAGSRIEIGGRYSRADYIVFRSAVEHDALSRITRPETATERDALGLPPVDR